MDFKERLLYELEELSVKSDRLLKYINATDRKTDTELEEKQLDIMNAYKNILRARILKLMK